MSLRPFERFVQGVYHHLGTALPDDFDADEPVHGFEFDHHGMAVKILEASDDDDPRVLVFCVFGGLPAETELDGLRKLMEINLFLGNEGNTVFGRDAATGEINFRYEQLLSTIALDNFVDALDQLAAQAAEWRETWFLDDARAGTPEMSAFQFA